MDFKKKNNEIYGISDKERMLWWININLYKLHRYSKKQFSSSFSWYFGGSIKYWVLWAKWQID